MIKDLQYPNEEDASSQSILCGQWVRVKSLTEIEQTLDLDGTLDGLPFMPEMTKFSGQRARVVRFANQVCANVGTVEIRHLANVVVLELERCDGQFHGGCEMGCDFLWKTQWLSGDVKSADSDNGGTLADQQFENEASADSNGRFQGKLIQLSQTANSDSSEGPSVCFRCQATELGAASSRKSAFNLKQYRIERETNGVSVSRIGGFLVTTLLRKITKQSESCEGPCRRTPVSRLDLKIGDKVKVKTFDEILKTLNAKGCNRGLWFDEAEMKPFCGTELSVTRVIKRLIDEHTGKLLELKVPSVVLNETQCSGLKRRFCGRGMLHFWRKVWLEKVE